ncbi:MAG TPA: hypothetical protein VJ729_01970 [Nitrososphaeraceae archaeon]|nr:hypothetical protein [Nitrososphaeraceae archaeon]
MLGFRGTKLLVQLIGHLKQHTNSITLHFNQVVVTKPTSKGNYSQRKQFGISNYS